MDSTVRIIWLRETDSTNSFLRRHGHEYTEPLVAVVADHQTAGRGQGTNRWESAPGQNVLLSLLTHPQHTAARDQFLLSMAGALAVHDTLSRYADGFSVKWPNDVYHADRKISGTLIETRLAGTDIRDCIFGVGININQTAFVSDAPNPVSLRQITGRETSRREVVEQVVDSFARLLADVERGEHTAILERYWDHLYRRRGLYDYEDAAGRFSAEIVRVEPTGHLVLHDTAGRERRYAFKEVKYII